ncbi:MAG TPA: MBL fold metallo-hydrolase [Gemmatimonadales bacterium]
MTITLRFWGTRGSIPTPGPGTTRYGGNTPCLSIASESRLVILDAGTGLRPLGHELMTRRGGPIAADILLSHTHWDHIQGLPFFKPLSAKGNEFCIYGAAQNGVALEEILRRQMDPMVFPVPLTAVAARVKVTEIEPGEFPLGELQVSAFRLRHPGTTLGYRLTPGGGGRSIAYVTDNELGEGGDYPVPADWRRRMVAFLRDTDTLIHDAMYAEQIIQARRGWGHSTPQEAVELAAEAGCRRLLLFHHEPEHDDAALDRLLEGTRKFAARLAPNLQVDAAAEGMELSLGEEAR